MIFGVGADLLVGGLYPDMAGWEAVVVLVPTGIWDGAHSILGLVPAS